MHNVANLWIRLDSAAESESTDSKIESLDSNLTESESNIESRIRYILKMDSIRLDSDSF